MKHPWITLVEIDGESRKTVSFTVEDGRLADPARTLAIYALKSGEFRPYRMLSEEEKKDIPTGVVVGGRSDGMEL